MNERVLEQVQSSLLTLSTKVDAFGRAAEEARAVAHEAKVAAEEAKAVAQEAKTAAEEAKALAWEAKVAAEEAKAVACEAKVAAEEARAVAQEAKKAAEEAKAAAQEAKVAAEEARAVAWEAKVAAEEAKAVAQEALTIAKRNAKKIESIEKRLAEVYELARRATVLTEQLSDGMRILAENQAALIAKVESFMDMASRRDAKFESAILGLEARVSNLERRMTMLEAWKGSPP